MVFYLHFEQDLLHPRETFHNILYTVRRIRPEEFGEKSVIKNFAKFTEKHLCKVQVFSC